MATRTINIALGGYIQLDQNDLTPGGATTQVNDGWLACRNSSTGSYVDQNNAFDPAAIQVKKWSSAGNGRYNIIRSYFACDTIGGLFGECVTSATLKIYGKTYGTADVIVVKADSEHPSNLTTASFNAISGWNSNFSPSDLTAYSSEVTTWDTSDYNEITLNAAARRALEVSGSYFEFCIMEHDHDYLGTTPFPSDSTNQVQNGLFWYHSAGAFSSKWPVLVCETTSAPCGYQNSVIGVASENIEKIMAVDSGDIDKVLGS